MTMILIIVVVVLLLGGGGGYYGYNRYGGTGLGGALGLVIVILIVLWLLGCWAHRIESALWRLFLAALRSALRNTGLYPGGASAKFA